MLVKLENPGSPNRRTPTYVRGKAGIITARYGEMVDPEFDRDHRVSWGPLYTVVFDLHDGENTRTFVDVHESWLESID